MIILKDTSTLVSLAKTAKEGTQFKLPSIIPHLKADTVYTLRAREGMMTLDVTWAGATLPPVLVTNIGTLHPDPESRHYAPATQTPAIVVEPSQDLYHLADTFGVGLRVLKAEVGTGLVAEKRKALSSKVYPFEEDMLVSAVMRTPEFVVGVMDVLGSLSLLYVSQHTTSANVPPMWLFAFNRDLGGTLLTENLSDLNTLLTYIKPRVVTAWIFNNEGWSVCDVDNLE